MKAFAFDFNGTLFNDNRYNLEAWRSFWRKHGEMLSEDEVRARCFGPGNADIFRSVYGDAISEEEIQRLSEEKEREYRAAAGATAETRQLMPGAVEMLDMLKAKGIPFVLATASPIENVQFYLNDLGVSRWMRLEDIVFDEGKLACKPAPDFYLEAARRLNVAPSEMTVVEDSPTGIQAAINAKVGRIIVIDRTAPIEWLRGNPAIDALIHDFYGFERYL